MSIMEEWVERTPSRMDELHKKMEQKKKRIPKCIISKRKRKKQISV